MRPATRWLASGALAAGTLAACGDAGSDGGRAPSPATDSGFEDAAEWLPTEAELEAEAAEITLENADREFEKLKADIESGG